MTLLSAAASLAANLQPTDRPCCVYAHRVLALAYGLDFGADLSAWHLWSTAAPWSPVEAAQRAGITDGSPSLPPSGPALRAGAWHLCQGWHGTPGAAGVTGHTWLWRAGDGDYGLRLDCAEAQWRDAPYHQEVLESWSTKIAGYRGGVAVAVLRRV